MTPHLAAAAFAALAATSASAEELPPRRADGGLAVGMEYALLDNDPLARGMAEAFAETGMPAMKLMPEATSWGNMQRRPGGPIDFRKLDRGVRAYQNAGFTELTIGLKSNNRWGSAGVRAFAVRDPSPSPEHMNAYRAWVGAVVERYDADGVDDMPGLRWPVRTYEIGVELSSYEPEPIARYLAALEAAYRAAHDADPEVRVAHVAFLTTPANLDVDDPSDYERVWRETRRVDDHHDLADLRAVLDRPDLFDVLNLHNLGDPYEIEDQMRWLAYETGRRGYAKPIIISDTLATSYVGWGPATTCVGRTLGVLARPATEADRCRLAAYFTRLVDKDPATLAWTRGFVAADHVQRATIAAEQGVERIHLAFVADIGFLTWPAARAGAGISAWGGALDVTPRGRVRSRRPAFYAVKQFITHTGGYRSVARLAADDPRTRVYRFDRDDGPVWIAWRDPGGVLLPDDDEPAAPVDIAVGDGRFWIENVIVDEGRTEGERAAVSAAHGRITTALRHAPVFIYAATE